MAIQISSCPVIDNNRCLVNIANATTAATANTYVLRDANGCIPETSLIKSLGLGTAAGGGYVICKASSVGWIVAPNSSEVSRTWYCRDDANTLANTCTSCTGWFVPTLSQLQNPGYCCRVYWDSFGSSNFWSSTESNATHSSSVRINDGVVFNSLKSNTLCVRAFRCVTY